MLGIFALLMNTTTQFSAVMKSFSYCYDIVNNKHQESLYTLFAKDHLFYFLSLLNYSSSSFSFYSLTLGQYNFFSWVPLVCFNNLWRTANCLVIPDRTSVCTHPWHQRLKPYLTNFILFYSLSSLPLFHFMCLSLLTVLFPVFVCLCSLF